MKIIYIIGNICAGKTTCIDELKKHKPTPTYYSIDDIRVETGIKTWEDDHAAWNTIINEILHNKPEACFIECSGTGIMYEKSVQIFKQNPEVKKIVHVVVHTSLNTCLSRFYHRPSKGLFFEDKYKITESITWINTKLLAISANYTINGNNSKGTMIAQFLRTFGIKPD